MRLLKLTLATLLVLLLLMTAAVWMLLRSDYFWRRVGEHAVALAQERLQARLQVGEITGNLFDGLFFLNLTLTTPEEEILRAQSLEVSLSWWSLLELKPVFGRLALSQPRLSLNQDEKGRWNIAALAAPAGTPVAAPRWRLPLPVREVTFRQILINDAEVTVTRRGESFSLKNLELEAAGAIESPLGPQPTIRVDKLRAAAPTPSGRVLLNGRLTYGGTSLKVPFLEIKTGQHTLMSLRGTADLRQGGQIQASGELALASGDIRRFWSHWPSEADVSAKVEAEGSTAQVRLTLEAKLRETRLTATGVLDSRGNTWQYEVNGALRHLSPGLLSLYDTALAEKVGESGPLDITFQGQGEGFAFPPARLSWKAATGPWKYGAIRVESLEASIAGDDRRQDFRLSINTSRGRVSFSAAGSLFAVPAGSFALRADSLDPEPFGLGLPRGSLLNASFTGTFAAPDWGALERLHLAGRMEAAGRFGSHGLKAEGRLAWQRGRLEIPQATLQLGNINFSLKGVLAGDILNFSHQGRSSPGGTWPVPAHLGGRFSWDGTLRGTPSAPEVTLKAQGQGLTYEAFKIQSLALTAQVSDWPPSRGHLSVQANGLKTPLGLFSQADLKATGDEQLWHFDLKGAGRDGEMLEIKGGAHLCERWLSLEKVQLRTRQLQVANLGPVDLTLAPGFELKPVTFRINQGKAGIQAASSGGRVSGRLEVQNLHLGWFTPASFPLTGVISGQATLSGEPGRPELQGSLNLEGGRYRELDFSWGRTTFAYHDGRLSLNGSLTTKNAGPTLSWDGHLPVRLSLTPWRFSLGEDGLRLSLRGDNVNLAMLPGLTREVESAQGAVKLQALVEGPLNQPRVSGQVSWGPATLKLRQAGATYRLQPGEIRLQGNRLILSPIVFESQGTATLEGELTLAGLGPDEVKARLRLDNFKAIDRLGSEALVNGVVNLSGRWPNLALQGKLLIPQATFRLSFFNLGPATVNQDIVLVRQKKPLKPETVKTSPPREPEMWRQLLMDLTVQAPKNVWVDDRTAKIEVSVDVQARKRPGQQLTTVGKIHALQGRVYIVGREFQVTKGVVDLPSQPGAEPMVDARIEYETGDVTLFADVSGPVSNPKIVLRGEPAISETDWMSYLLYGKPIAALSREEQGAAMAAGAFGGLATKMILRDFLGMAPPITKGLTITYQHRNDPLYRDDPYQVVIQYRLNRRFSIQSQVGGRNTGGDVLFNLDF